MQLSLDRRSFMIAAGSGTLMPGAARAQFANGYIWLNEPASWSQSGRTLTMRAEAKTDFWRKTFFGYITDNGHLLGRRVEGDFVATVNVSGKYAAQYDQAGLMVRLDRTCWMKCGVEFVDNVPNISSVFTRDYSDWAGIPRDAPIDSLWIRVARKGSALTFSFSADGRTYKEVRQGYLTDVPALTVGVMAAAPEGTGFDASFSGFEIVRA